MKKKICLLFTLILSIFMFSGIVEADDNLVCIYGRGNDKYKLLQSNEKQILYESHSKEVKWDLMNYKYELVIYNEDGSVLVDDISYEEHDSEKFGKISKCPSNFAFSVTHGTMAGNADLKYYFYFAYDESMFPDLDKYPLIPNDDTGNETDKVPVDTNVFYYQYNNLYREEAGKETNKWYAECSYKILDSQFSHPIYLYFNEEKYILINENSSCGANYLDFSLIELNEYFGKVLYQCPVRLYVDNSSYDTTGAWNCNFSLKNNGHPFDAVNDRNIVSVYVPTLEPEEEIDDCRTLFGEDLLNRIDDIMNIIKILVPILLIGFGIFDFAKAVFAGNGDNMKKSQKTFFNRILAAILVFIAPIFINLILNLANQVWSDIKADTCINQTE